MDLPNILTNEILSSVKQIVDDEIKNIEKTYPELSGENKRKLAITAIESSYKLLDKAVNFPELVDNIVYALIPILVDGAVAIANETGFFHPPF